VNGAASRHGHRRSRPARDRLTRHAGELATLNVDYQERFGYIFIVCATGKSSADILAALGARLSNDSQTELAVAADEQRKITALRLQKLVMRTHD
jgi:2-oxo-4-hydroxy-4-carboxy--5-ureidoimidazoline (OHCU) decarboxylase